MRPGQEFLDAFDVFDLTLSPSTLSSNSGHNNNAHSCRFQGRCGQGEEAGVKVFRALVADVVITCGGSSTSPCFSPRAPHAARPSCAALATRQGDCLPSPLAHFPDYSAARLQPWTGGRGPQERGRNAEGGSGCGPGVLSPDWQPRRCFLETPRPGEPSGGGLVAPDPGLTLLPLHVSTWRPRPLMPPPYCTVWLTTTVKPLT